MNESLAVKVAAPCCLIPSAGLGVRHQLAGVPSYRHLVNLAPSSSTITRQSGRRPAVPIYDAEGTLAHRRACNHVLAVFRSPKLRCVSSSVPAPASSNSGQVAVPHRHIKTSPTASQFRLRHRRALVDGGLGWARYG